MQSEWTAKSSLQDRVFAKEQKSTSLTISQLNVIKWVLSLLSTRPNCTHSSALPRPIPFDWKISLCSFDSNWWRTRPPFMFSRTICSMYCRLYLNANECADLRAQHRAFNSLWPWQRSSAETLRGADCANTVFVNEDSYYKCTVYLVNVLVHYRCCGLLHLAKMLTGDPTSTSFSYFLHTIVLFGVGVYCVQLRAQT